MSSNCDKCGHHIADCVCDMIKMEKQRQNNCEHIYGNYMSDYYGGRLITNINDKDFTDDKYYCRKFNYCPECGKRLINE